ncbi:MAG: S24/S26 family peptidase [Acidobacteriota bacterium]
MTPSNDHESARLQREQLLALTKEALSTLTEGSIVVSDTSRSMIPVLRGGERLHWIKPSQPPRQGQMLIYVQAPGPIVHRVIGRRADGGWRTKGDGRGGFDQQPVTRDELLGVVVAIERDGAVVHVDRLGGRLYARIAAWVSLIGGLLFVMASFSDAALRRLLRRRTHLSLAQVLAWWIGRAAQHAWYTIGFRICHGSWHKETRA